MTIVESLVPSKVPVMLCIFVKHINTCTRGEDVARFFFKKKNDELNFGSAGSLWLHGLFSCCSDGGLLFAPEFKL